MTTNELVEHLEKYKEAFPCILDMQLNVMIRTPKKKKEYCYTIIGVNFNDKIPILETEDLIKSGGMWI